MFGQKRLSREGGIKLIVKELCIRMAQKGYEVTCYNRSSQQARETELDSQELHEMKIKQKNVPTIERKGIAAVSASFFDTLYCVIGRYDVVHIHAEESAFFRFIGLGCQKHHFNI
ncbi:hypothetical protein NE606_08780 [Agathobaculum butyriciproducens]|nr:hypothetical protein [Agathobaculum butyriciproducens]